MSELVIRPAGDAAVLVELGSTIDLALNRRVHGVAEAVKRELARRGTVEVIAGYTSFLVSYDPGTLRYESVVALIHGATQEEDPPPRPVRRFTLPATYGGEFGPDLEAVASYHQMEPEEVIRLHANRDYPIYCLGFSPGFPLLGGLPEALHTPRLDTPRPRVPAGSVAIGSAQTGVYPTATPGGWRLIGRTPLVLCDVSRTPPVPYRAGDVIRFVSIDRAEFDRLQGEHRLPESEPVAQEPA